MNYSEAKEILDHARNNEKKLENNTYMRYVELMNANYYGLSKDIAICLHSTNVVILHANGDVTFNSGGWRTVTTKDRMNKYSPRVTGEKHGAHWQVYQTKREWYTCYYHGNGVHSKSIPFEDGMRLGSHNIPSNETVTV